MRNVNKKVILLLASLGILCVVTIFFLVGQRYLGSQPRTVGTQSTITGTVTSKFTDCVGGEEISKSGIITPIKDVSCDGGSTITIDYKDIFITSTGEVLPNDSYSIDVSSIKVGDRVKVRYVTNSAGYKSLNCKSCGVIKAKN